MNETETIIETSNSILLDASNTISFNNHMITLMIFLIIFVAMLTGVILGCFFFNFFKK